MAEHNGNSICGKEPVERVNPFKELKIADNDFLNRIQDRSPCSKCKKSRKFFCYTCYIPVDKLIDLIPNIELPISIDIIKHKNEIEGKSTSVHAAILAPNNVKIYEYPMIPDYSQESGAFLIFPSPKSTSVKSLFSNDIELMQLPKGHCIGTLLTNRSKDYRSTVTNDMINGIIVKKAIFIDSTWNQSRSICKDEKISSLRCIVLQNRMSQFWRHHKGSPRWYLATIEAIHQFLIEFHINAWGLDEMYRGFDNLGLNMTEIYDQSKEHAKHGSASIQPYNAVLPKHITAEIAETRKTRRCRFFKVRPLYFDEHTNNLNWFLSIYHIQHVEFEIDYVLSQIFRKFLVEYELIDAKI